MDIREIKNARWLESGGIDCEVLFTGADDFVPYTATSSDRAETGQFIWQALQSGKWGRVLRAAPEMPEAAKEGRRHEIEVWRDEQESREFIFEHDGRRWDAGKASSSRLSPVVAAAGSGELPAGFFWTDADNNDVMLTPEGLIGLYAGMNRAMVIQGFKIHERQREMKEEIGLLKTVAGVSEYKVGWPEVPGE